MDPMTGPEHYSQAERLLAKSDDHAGPITTRLIAQAQVHATLALVAVTEAVAAPVRIVESSEMVDLGEQGTRVVNQVHSVCSCGLCGERRG
jgi:hypothetical protein